MDAWMHLCSCRTFAQRHSNSWKNSYHWASRHAVDQALSNCLSPMGIIMYSLCLCMRLPMLYSFCTICIYSYVYVYISCICVYIYNYINITRERYRGTRGNGHGDLRFLEYRSIGLAGNGQPSPGQVLATGIFMAETIWFSRKSPKNLGIPHF